MYIFVVDLLESRIIHSSSIVFAAKITSTELDIFFTPALNITG